MNSIVAANTSLHLFIILCLMFLMYYCSAVASKSIALKEQMCLLSKMRIGEYVVVCGIVGKIHEINERTIILQTSTSTIEVEKKMVTAIFSTVPI